MLAKKAIYEVDMDEVEVKGYVCGLYAWPAGAEITAKGWLSANIEHAR